jgi:hypothetical protein
MMFFIRLLRVLGILAVIVGALFKVQHWLYGSLILTMGMIALAFVILAEFISGELRRREEKSSQTTSDRF